MPANEGVSIFARYLDPEKEPPAVDPANELLEWITYKWNGPTISGRDIYRHGPNFIREDPKSAFSLAKVLVQRGSLIPLVPHRRDRQLWHVIREPVRK